MILRLVCGSTLKVIEVEDVSQVVVMASSGEAVACAHETPGGAIVASHAGNSDFDKTLISLGLKPSKVISVE